MSQKAPHFGSAIVPWNASWTSEARYELRPCRWAGGKLAVWSPHKPGEGKPVFAKPHFVRQRQSIAKYLCTVCGEHTPTSDRWWFGHGEYREGMFMTQEAPVHHVCGELSLEKCPHLRKLDAHLERFPQPHSILHAVVGGPAVVDDFGIDTAGRTVIGALKFAWPAEQIRLSRTGELA